MTEPSPAAVVVLAAGQGTRMRSARAKVLHEVAGRSLLGHVLAATAPLGAVRTLVVVGHGRDAVTEHLAALAPDAAPVVQAEQRGTGHAVRTALAAAGELPAGPVLVVPGDAPLLTAPTLRALLAEHARAGAAATLLTARLPDPTGYGRVVRGDAGAVRAVVEERDADAATSALDEVAVSVYAFEPAALADALGRLRTDNAQGEEYLTDVVALLVGDGRTVAAVPAADWQETLGVNDRAQLAEARRLLRDRLVGAWLRAGVDVLDPATVWVDVDVRLEPDCTIHPATRLHGRTTVAAGASVGPDSSLTDTEVGADAVVSHAVCERAVIGPGAQVGPFSYLRPGTRLGPGAKAGTFVEMKNADVGAGTKVPHLSYVGDATIGEHTNIGAATVFVNYDGVAKHHTRIGSHARTGADNMFVAPVEVGDGAYTAAGSVITEDVPPGALAVARGRQRNVDGWVARKRPGTPAAQAAGRAGTAQDQGAGPGLADRADSEQGETP